MATPPKQVRLDIALFPKEPWATALVDAINQMSQETTTALASAGPTYKTLKFKTGSTVADSFPIAINVEKPLASIRVAQVIRGGTLAGSAISVQWTMLSRARTGPLQANITLITGLSASTTYEVKLALE